MKNQNYKNIKTIEDACAAKGVNLDAMRSAIANAEGIPEEYRRHLQFYAAAMVVTDAINGEWVPDMANKSQPKYHVYFWIDKSGLGFSDVGDGYADTIAGVGSRLAFETREQALYAGETFQEMYKEICLKR